MKTYFEYKNQIQGFKEVAETVKTIEKISASSVHFLKIKVSSLNIYSEFTKQILQELSYFYLPKGNSLLQGKVSGQKVLIIITGDKGLVGGLWHNMINSFLNKKNEYKKIIIIGNKGTEYLREEKIKFIKAFSDIAEISEKEKIDEITKYAFDIFTKEDIFKINIMYPQFISLASQKPIIVPFLPFEFKLNDFLNDQSNINSLPIFEPTKQRIFNKLLKKYIAVYFHKIILEAKLSELSARIVATEHATAKTKEFMQKLKLSFIKNKHNNNTQRQLESFAAHKTSL